MKKQRITTFEQAVEYLFDIPRFTGKNSIEDTKIFLSRLGNPDRKLKIIHVAGTNGKGSVCAYLRSVLETAGKSVAVFTSPHLVDVRERFIIEGRMPEKETFLAAFLKIFNMLDWEALEQDRGYHPSFFEYMFFMAMIMFTENPVDYCILETGLGGRLDATNSVFHKEIAVITRIGLDHVEYLGDTLEAIAGEKAGIMEAGVPLVFTDCEKSVTEVFCQRAKELGSPVYGVSKQDYAFTKFKKKSIDFSLHTSYYGYIPLTLRTIARYQMENASLAVRTIEELGLWQEISAEQVKEGIQKCFWQGRMEEILPGVYVDGAHNGDGIRAFVETVTEDGFAGERVLLFGVVKDKDYENMCSLIAKTGLFQKINVVKLRSGRRLGVDELKRTMEKCLAGNKKIQIGAYETVEVALKEILSEQTDDQRIYIAGSLYLVGEVKEICDRLR